MFSNMIRTPVSCKQVQQSGVVWTSRATPLSCKYQTVHTVSMLWSARGVQLVCVWYGCGMLVCDVCRWRRGVNSCHILATRTPDQRRSSASPAAGAGAGVRKCREGRHHLLSHLLCVHEGNWLQLNCVYWEIHSRKIKREEAAAMEDY